MRKIILFLLLIFSFTSLVSCGTIRNILGEDKYAKLESKLDAAWNEVAKDALTELTDDAWRGLGFGKTLDWPKNGLAGSLPKLRDGKLEFCYSTDDASCGYITFSSIEEDKLQDYIERLNEIGYSQTEKISGYNTVLTFDNDYLGLIYNSTEKELKLYFASSLAVLESLRG